MKIISIALTIFLYSVVCANNYYVNAASPPNGNGSQLNPWNALSYVSNSYFGPGDTIFVAKGTYANDPLFMRSSGMEGNPIVISGYKDQPHDITKYNLTNPDASAGPVLDGFTPGAGMAIDMNGQDYVKIENLQITNYRVGYRNDRSPRITSTGIHLKNLFMRTIGERSNTYNNGYSGWGILIDDAHNTVEDCTVIDAGAEGFGIYGDYNTITGCEAKGISNTNGTDYYIVIWGNYNQVSNCCVERSEFVTSNSGHGIGIKKGGHDNIITNCKSINTNKGFYINGAKTQNNLFYACEAEKGVGIVLREGPRFNRFQRCRVRNAAIGVRMFESDTLASFGTGASFHTIFDNCLFDSNTIAVELLEMPHSNITDSNLFVNCRIAHSYYLFAITGTNVCNQFTNCSFEELGDYQLHTTPIDDNKFKFSYCNFWKNCVDFEIPNGPKITEHDPQYMDPEMDDFRLSPTSPFIDAGTHNVGCSFHVTIPLPAQDFMGWPSPIDGDGDSVAKFDIGICEYNPNSHGMLIVDNTKPIHSATTLPSKPMTKIETKTSLYPNLINLHSSRTVYVEGAETNESYRIDLINLHGQKVFSKESHSYYLQVPQSLPTGIYWIRIQGATLDEVHPLVIEN